VESEPAALLRPDQERHPLQDPVQDRRQRADEVGHPDELLLPKSPGLSLRYAALNIDTGIVAGPAGATSLANPNGQGTVWLITRNTTYTATSPCVAQGKCTAGQFVNPNISAAQLLVPLVPPQTEFGDRINQLDINVVKSIKIGHSTCSRSSTSSTC
jgi:hypothetical protein